MVNRLTDTEIVVTAANGLIGREALGLARSLYPDVRIAALSRRDPVRPLQGVEYVRGELPGPIPDRLFGRGNTILLHLASRLKAKGLEDYRRANVEGTKALLSLGGHRIKKVIYGSSMSVYGQGPFHEVDETALRRPETALAVSRCEAEDVIADFCGCRSIPCYLLRPRFVLGHGDTETLPMLMRLHRKGIMIARGEQRFSFIDVEDYAGIICHLISYPGCRQEAVNVGYSEPLSLKEMFSIMGPARRPRRVPVSWIIGLGLDIPPVRRLRTKLQLIGRDQVLSVHKLCRIYSPISTMDAKEKFARIVKAARGGP